MSDLTSPRAMIGALLFMLAGPIFWALQYTFMYGAQSALCAFGTGSDAGGQNPLAAWTVAGVSIICLGGILVVFLFPRASYRLLAGGHTAPEQFSFLKSVMRVLAALAALAIIYAAISPAFMPACAQLR